MTPEGVVSWSLKQISEWRAAQKKRSTHASGAIVVSAQQDRSWSPPALGTLKINVDASVISGNKFFSIGMVARNHQGHFIRGKVMKFEGCVSVMEAESVGVLQALR